MKNLTKILCSLLMLAIVTPATEAYSVNNNVHSEQKQEKPKKEKKQKEKKQKKEKKEKQPKGKKPVNWQMPAITGNEDFDKYLHKCNDLDGALKEYAAGIPYYSVVFYAKVDDVTGEPQKNAAGEELYIAVIEDENGKVRNAGRAIVQYAEIILRGTTILAECADVTALTVTATAALPSLGPMAITHAKYLKLGPALAAEGVRELNNIVNNLKEQTSNIKALKEISTTEGEMSDVIYTISSSGIVSVSGGDVNFDEMEAISEEKVAEIDSACAE